MDSFLSILKIIAPLIVISFISIFITKIIKLSDLIVRVLLIFLLNWFQILIPIQILSLFKAVTLENIIIFYSVSFTICLAVLLIKKIRFRIDLKRIKKLLSDFYRGLEINSILRKAVIIWIIVIIIATFIFGITIPPSNYDSMTYHLTRAAFWKQYQSIDHYLSRNVRQLENPVNAEIGFLWIMLFTNSDTILFLVQWSSLIIILLALYKLLRMFDFKKSVSLLCSFFFATLNMVIFQASSTQNDLITACFVLLAVYFIIKTLKNNKIDIRYIIFAGLTAGLAIGTKGYTYLFIPGILIFMIIYGKNTKLKWIKISYLILFSIIGTMLFASYNMIQNYLSFGNIFSSGGTIHMMRINDPGMATFISNLSRHLVSFYQLKDYDHGTISTLIQRGLNSLHSILNIEISSGRTTWPGTEFYLSGLALNMDFTYFGPVCSLIIIPSFIYNAILLPTFIKIRNDNGLLRKYKDTLKFITIPITFFIMYIYIFKWQPWAGRLMIAFVLLMMPSFALLLECLSKIKIKKIFNMIITLLFVIAFVISSKVMFNNWDYRVIPIGGNSIYSIEYPERRFNYSPPYVKEIKKITEQYIPEDGRLGLITSGDDWDYIFFGDNFHRNLTYISEKDYKEKEIKELIKQYRLNGIIINDLSVEYLPDNNDLENINIEVAGNYRLYYLP